MRTWPLGWKIVFWIGVVIAGVAVLFGLLWLVGLIKFAPQEVPAATSEVKEKIVYVEITSTPKPAPEATPIPTSQPTASSISTKIEEGCHVIHDSVVVEIMDHVSTSGAYIHLEYWWDGQPERETILTASEAAGGRYNFSKPLKGWVWEYSLGCSFDQVKNQVDQHIVRRLAGKANNAGYVLWKDTGLFTPVPLP